MDCALCVHDAIALDFDFLSLNWRCPKRAPGIRRGTLQKMPGKALKAHPPVDPLIENNQ